MSRPAAFMKERMKKDYTRLSFPDAPFPHAIQLIFKKYDYNEYVAKSVVGNLNADAGESAMSTQWANAQSRRVKAQENQTTVIELPMPANLTDSTGLSIDGFERTMLETFISEKAGQFLGGEGGGIAGILQNVGSGAVDLINDTPGARDKFAAQLGVNKEFLGAAFKAIGKQALSSIVGENAISATTGMATNPQKTLFFNGVDLRSYDFQFSLFPESAEEAETIRKIIRAVKYQTLPKVRNLNPTGATDDALATLGGSALTKAYLEYPAIVFVNLLGVDERHFTRFKPCMIKGFNVSYGGEGNPTIAEGGVPAQVDIAMSLQEIEIQTAEDYSPEETGTGSADAGAGE